MGNSLDKQTERQLIQKLIYIETLDHSQQHDKTLKRCHPLAQIQQLDYNKFIEMENGRPITFVELGNIEIYRLRQPPYEYIMKYEKLLMLQDPTCHEFISFLKSTTYELNHKSLAKIHHISSRQRTLTYHRTESHMCIRTLTTTVFVNYYSFTLQQVLNKRSKVENLRLTSQELWYVLSSLAELGAYLQSKGLAFGGYHSKNITVSPEGYIKLYTHQIQKGNRHSGCYRAIDLMTSKKRSQNYPSQQVQQDSGRESIEGNRAKSNLSNRRSQDNPVSSKRSCHKFEQHSQHSTPKIDSQAQSLLKFITEDMPVAPQYLPILQSHSKQSVLEYNRRNVDSVFKGEVFTLGILMATLMTDQSPDSFYEIKVACSQDKLRQKRLQNNHETKTTKTANANKDRQLHTTKARSSCRSTSSSLIAHRSSQYCECGSSKRCSKIQRIIFAGERFHNLLQNLSRRGIYTTELVDIVCKMVDPDPSMRLSFSQICERLQFLRESDSKMSIGGCVRMFDDQQNPIVPRVKFRQEIKSPTDKSLQYYLDQSQKQQNQKKNGIQDNSFAGQLTVSPIALTVSNNSRPKTPIQSCSRERPGVSLISKRPEYSHNMVRQLLYFGSIRQKQVAQRVEKQPSPPSQLQSSKQNRNCGKRRPNRLFIQLHKKTVPCSSSEKVTFRTTVTIDLQSQKSNVKPKSIGKMIREPVRIRKLSRLSSPNTYMSIIENVPQSLSHREKSLQQEFLINQRLASDAVKTVY